jgi:hypothetical protein
MTDLKHPPGLFAASPCLAADITPGHFDPLAVEVGGAAL